MSMVSYAAGSRYLSLIGGVCMSFYDWYCDLPPASPQTWGEQTDVPESADWYNAGFMILWGSNVPQTRTPDAHFYTEARYRGMKSAVICPDYSEASKFGDIWLSVKQGTDAALAMAMGHVILKEYPRRPAGPVFPRLLPPVHRHADAGAAGPPGRRAGPRPLRARVRLRRGARRGQQPRLEDGRLSTRRPAAIVAPRGSIGFRWGEKGKWNLEEKDGGGEPRSCACRWPTSATTWPRWRSPISATSATSTSPRPATPAC
jgi:nitrate reductase alpha subunit